MAMTINSMAKSVGADVYYSAAFRRMIETHLNYLKNHPQSRQLEVDPNLGWRYEGDLTSYLRTLGYTDPYHFVIMRMNNMNSIDDLKSGITQLLVPDVTVVDQLRAVFQTTTKKMS